MALQSSGVISIGDIASEFGGSAPHALSEYYGAATGVPASGTIALSDFYGTSSGGGTATATLTPDEDGSDFSYLRHDRRGFGAEGKCDFYYPESVGSSYDDAFGSLTNTTGLISNCTVTSIAIVNISGGVAFPNSKILLVQVQGTATQTSFSSISFTGYLPSANSNQTYNLSTTAGSCSFNTPYRLNNDGVANMKQWAWFLGTFGGTSQTSGTADLSNVWDIITYADANNGTVSITVS